MDNETLGTAFGDIDQELIDSVLRRSDHGIEPTTPLTTLSNWQLYQFHLCRPCPKAIYQAILDRIERATDSAGYFTGDMIGAVLRLPVELIDEAMAHRVSELLDDLEEVVENYHRWRNDPSWGPYNTAAEDRR